MAFAKFNLFVSYIHNRVGSIVKTSLAGEIS